MIRPKPTIFLVHLPNTKTQNKKPRPRLIQEARMLFNDFAYIYPICVYTAPVHADRKATHDAMLSVAAQKDFHFSVSHQLQAF